VFDRVEDRLLVLLQVAVVGHRQALDQRQQAHQVADDAARLAAHQLGDVGVALLGHDRRAGGERVTDPGEAQLRGGPQHDLLPQPRQVHGQGGAGGDHLDREVAGGDGVHGVLRDRAKPSSSA
jgi:hypothetical protein